MESDSALAAQSDRVQILLADLWRAADQILDVVVLSMDVAASELIGTARCENARETRRELGRRPGRVIWEVATSHRRLHETRTD